MPNQDPTPSPEEFFKLQKDLDAVSAQLRTARGQLHALMNSLPGGLFCCMANENLDLIYCSQSFLTLFGYDSEADLRQHTGNSFRALIYPPDYPASIDQVAEQLTLGPHKELVYRGIRKDGSLFWIQDHGHLIEEDGYRFYLCILQDTSNTVRAMEDLRLSLERYQIVMDQTNDIIFEWDLRGGDLFYSSNWQKKFGYAPCTDCGTNFTPLVRYLHPEDQDRVRRLIGTLHTAAAYIQFECRIRCQDGSHLWCRVRCTSQPDRDGKVFRVVGCIADVDQEIRRSQQLKLLAETDPLTGLLNKATARLQMEEALAQRSDGTRYALVLLDVDNFKQVNTILGHLGGDVLLTDLAKTLREFIHPQDLCGRVGGDEFSLLLCDVGDRAQCEERVRALTSELAQLLPGSDFAISSSLGVALAPDDGTDYHTLFQNADIALSQAKHSGKADFAFYNPEQQLTASGNMGTLIDNRESSSFTSRLAMYIFRQLYLSDDIETAIPKIMAITGKQLDVSRVYIFEETEDGSYINNTFEWCNTDIIPVKDMLQNLSYEMLGDYKANFNDEDIFYCRDVSTLPLSQQEILAPQGVRAMLQCAIRDNGHYRGFVGFDECRDYRFWTQEQVDTLALISEILGLFLIRGRSQTRIARNLDLLKLVLDSQDAWVYVVDASDYHIIYANSHTRGVSSDDIVGDFCYHSFFCRDTPCEQCPIRGLIEHGGSDYRTVLYSQVVGSHVNAKANRLIWTEGKPVYLVSCTPADEP